MRWKWFKNKNSFFNQKYIPEVSRFLNLDRNLSNCKNPCILNSMKQWNWIMKIANYRWNIKCWNLIMIYYKNNTILLNKDMERKRDSIKSWSKTWDKYWEIYKKPKALKKYLKKSKKDITRLIKKWNKAVIAFLLNQMSVLWKVPKVDI